jgi:hypothetical protein
MTNEACPLFFSVTAKGDPMITGEITISTCYGEAVIPVEILDKGPRSGTVWVRALNNLNPFTRMSHGGPCQDNTAVWAIPNVRNVQVIPEEEPQVLVELPHAEQPEPAPDWFLEMAYEDRSYVDD